jgi:hypothetical protein
MAEENAKLDPWEHLQDVLRKVFKKEVMEEFRDIDNDDFEDIRTPRSSLRTACLPTDNDTTAMLTLRMLLFYIVLRRAQDMQAPLIGMPYWEQSSARKHRPQVMLHFSQDKAEIDIDAQKSPVWGQISFRLMNETTATITESKLKSIAQRIKSQFGRRSGQIWYRGRNMAAYADIENGCQFKILTDTKSHAIDLIRAVLDCAGVAYNSDNLSYTTCDSASSRYPANAGNQSIMGTMYKRPIKRRICKTRFRYAVAIVHGRPTPIPLYDESGRYIAPLVDNL